MTTKNLLVELFVEELPPKALKKLGEAFAGTLFESLKAQGLTTIESAVTPYASPRRLAAHITQVAAQAADRPLRQKLMPVGVGLDAEGRPTPALLKKLAALGAGPEAAGHLQRAMDGKAETLFLDTVAPGADLAPGLQKALDEAIAKLPISKVMAYQLGDGWSTVKFVRPAHGLVALHGDAVVPVRALGLTAGRETHGHRFEAKRDPIILRNADDYVEQIQDDGRVIPEFSKRRAKIARQLETSWVESGIAVGSVGIVGGLGPAGIVGGVKPIADDALLDEVTALVEWPNVLVGQFDAAFLEVPQECLILTMKANQKYFPLLDADGKLTNKFLVVANISPADPSAVIGGNERVVRPRLADAKFFYDQDRKKRLEDRVLGLAKVVYHGKLGTQGERVGRVQAMARAIGEKLGGGELAHLADHAALLAKADLLTDMVGEFPELQGIMGRYYAMHDGEDRHVADAIEDHYKTRFAGDALPRNEVGVVVALADKLETLVGLFGIGERPTGDKDPFALRRHALGVVRMLMERDLPLELNELLERAAQVFGVEGAHQVSPGIAVETPRMVAEFIYDRLAGLLREQGYSAQEVEAVLALRPQRLGDIRRRLEAVRAFAALPEAAALAAANKRVGNILKKSGQAAAAEMNGALLQEAAERALAASLAEVGPAAQAAYERGDYTASLKALAALKAPVDAFFDLVMVNVDDPMLRTNRLALLRRLHAAMNRVADLSALSA